MKRKHTSDEHFNPRSHKGSDGTTGLYYAKFSFQSTLPQGERLRFGSQAVRHLHFNPRSHKGSDGYYKSWKHLLYKFQSTLPQGERRNLLLQFLVIPHFNPRSHKGSDDLIRILKLGHDISIHAPTRGATWDEWRIWIPIHISIHAPTRGATTIQRMMQPPRIFQSTLPQGERRLARVREKHHKRFQSTLPQGERRRSRIRRTKVSTISIHAPTRGATRHNHNENRSFRNFNPRSHKGSDRNCYDAILERGNFNPRSHKGSDGVLIDNVFCCVLFQSTLPQGERRLYLEELKM